MVARRMQTALGLLAGIAAAGAWAAPTQAAVWKQNDFEGSGKWYSGATLTTDQAHGGVQSISFAGADSIREYAPFALMPTLAPGETFGSFVYSLWIFDNNDTTQSYQLGLKFAKADNSGEAPTNYYVSSYTGADAGWTQLTLDFTAEANARYAQTRVKIGRIYVRAYKPSGTYSTYYVDDAKLEYTIVPEPAGLSVLGLGALALVRRRKAN